MLPSDLSAHLSPRLPVRPRTRFAPAPTGYLHLGHVLNALWVWELARELNGEVLLRIEDHDRGRCRPEYEETLLEDLAWLGFIHPDRLDRPDRPDRPVRLDRPVRPVCPVRQSSRSAIYQTALDRLDAMGLVYACTCSRKDIAEVAEDSFRRGTALSRHLPRCGPCAEGAGLRVRMEPGVESFTDGVLGAVEQDPAAQCGDLLVRDRNGNWTYQFAVTVDDLEQGIDLVIRGTDILSSTGRQIRLARLLGRPVPPVYVHHPLILRPDGRKLSKASGDTAVRELRERGWSAERVREAAVKALSG